MKDFVFTLAEGATHVAMSKCCRKFAFTLAEVLITLGIIGVVAAVTMPTLIANHQKKVFASQLKKTYSGFGQILQRAQVDYGDADKWDIMTDEVLGSDEYKDSLAGFINTHIFPYMKITKDCGYEKTSKCPKIDIIIPSGGNYRTNNHFQNSYAFYSNDGVKYNITLNGRRDTNGDVKTVNDMIIIVDVNGNKKPNRMGRDVFAMQFIYGKLKMYEYMIATSLHDPINNCTSGNGLECGMLIQENGWEFPDNYPW